MQGSSRKRTRSPPPTQCDRKRNGKITAADSVTELVHAVGDIKDALLDPGEPTSQLMAPSPKRCKEAITALASDAAIELTPRRKVKLIKLFRKETSLADTYLALASDDVLRAGYMHEELEEVMFSLK